MRTLSDHPAHLQVCQRGPRKPLKRYVTLKKETCCLTCARLQPLANAILSRVFSRGGGAVTRIALVPQGCQRVFGYAHPAVAHLAGVCCRTTNPQAPARMLEKERGMHGRRGECVSAARAREKERVSASARVFSKRWAPCVAHEGLVLEALAAASLRANRWTCAKREA